MTPFMWRVQELLEGSTGAAPTTVPATEVTVAEGADTQVLIRSLAEQLVSEANAILSWHEADPAGSAGSEASELTLVDEYGPGALAFTVAYGARSARIETVISGHRATAQLFSGATTDPLPRALADESQMEALILDLLAGDR